MFCFFKLYVSKIYVTDCYCFVFLCDAKFVWLVLLYLNIVGGFSVVWSKFLSSFIVGGVHGLSAHRQTFYEIVVQFSDRIQSKSLG